MLCVTQAQPVSSDVLLKTPETAAWIGITSGTLRHWRTQGRGPAWLRLDGFAIRYRPADVQAWIDAQASGTRGEVPA